MSDLTCAYIALAAGVVNACVACGFMWQLPEAKQYNYLNRKEDQGHASELDYIVMDDVQEFQDSPLQSPRAQQLLQYFEKCA